MCMWYVVCAFLCGVDHIVIPPHSHPILLLPERWHLMNSVNTAAIYYLYSISLCMYTPTHVHAHTLHTHSYTNIHAHRSSQALSRKWFSAAFAEASHFPSSATGSSPLPHWRTRVSCSVWAASACCSACSKCTSCWPLQTHSTCSMICTSQTTVCGCRVLGEVG